MKKIQIEISNLYDIRSRIVHSGKNRFREEDLFNIKNYTKSCILRILRDEAFKSMDENEFIDWIDFYFCQEKNNNIKPME